MEKYLEELQSTETPGIISLMHVCPVFNSSGPTGLPSGRNDKGENIFVAKATTIL